MFPKYVILPYFRGDYVRFLGFFNKATVYTPGRIFTQNTSNDVVPGKEVPFWVSMTIFYIWTLKFPKNRHFGTDFDWTVFCDRKPL